MNIEEKAKAYDEALERAKKLLLGNEHSNTIRSYFEHIFPELHESEDERIRKELIQFLTEIKNISEGGRDSWHVRKEDAEMCNRFLAYLEKQKEQKPTLSEEDESIRKEIIEHIKDQIDSFISAPDCRDKYEEEELARYKSWIAYLEKQNPTNIELIQQSWYMEGYQDREHNREPKWIVKTGEGGPRYEENPKYGQPLAEEQKPTEIDEIIRKTRSEGRQEVIDNPKYYQLLKIEEMPKPAEWSKQQVVNALTSMLNERITPFHQKSLDGTIGDKEKMFMDALVEMRSFINSPSFDIGKENSAEWSEEDEDNRLAINKAIWEYDEFSQGDAIKLINWLKSLHPSWKPSEEQMRALNKVVNGEVLLTTQHKNLESLYENLKKLLS